MLLNNDQNPDRVSNPVRVSGVVAKRFEFQKRIYYQSFEGHIKDGLKLLRAYFNQKRYVVEQFCRRWNIDFELFCRNLFLVVALHDIGKLTVEFQQNIKQGKKSHRHPHPFFALSILEKIPFDNIEGLPLPTFAILGHHTQLHKMIYNSGKIASRVTYIEDEIIDFLNHRIKVLFEELNFTPFFKYPNLHLRKWENMNQPTIFDRFILRFVRRAELGDYKVKSIFTYFFSILQLCDDYSSAHFKLYVERETPDAELLHSVITSTNDFVYDLKLDEQEFKKRLFKDLVPYVFQEELAGNASKFSFLYAPCGRGKTEAALWWAEQIRNKMNRDRIIFALPTQVTCNAMFSRLVEDDEKGYGFGENNVGLFHGKSLIALKYRLKDNSEFKYDEEEKEQEDDVDFKTYDILKDNQFKGNVFFKPITVTTIDHLAYALVHGFSQADFTCGNLQNAVIIFDEVHYYEQHTLNILMRLIQFMRKMDIPHLLMTGTAPQFFLDAIEKDYNIISDTEGIAFKPFIMTKQNDVNLLNNESVFESILKDYQADRNIFVILNQVNWAQGFYNDLKEYLEFKGIEASIVLYHSRFIHRDRVKKEKEIKQIIRNKPCILVATQVIEISLDISSDVMYTTIAPPDAIGQRAGRLNRSGKHFKNGQVYELKLFSVDNHRPYPENIIINSWNHFRDGPMTYAGIKDVCDLVYEGIRLKKDRTFREFFSRNVLFGNHHSEITFGDDEGRSFKVREDNFQQIDVVPSSVFEKAEQKVTAGKDFWAEYKVKIPAYKVHQDIQEFGQLYNFRKHPQYRVLECDFEYDYELGIQIDKFFKRTEFI